MIRKKGLFLMSASSNSGKTVIANGLINIAAQAEKDVQFYKALSIDANFLRTKDGSIVGGYFREYSLNARKALVAQNNTIYFNPISKIVYMHGKPLVNSNLVTRDNIACDQIPQDVVNEIRLQMTKDVSYLKDRSDIIVAEGGGNCLLGDALEFANRWPAIKFEFPVVIVIEGRDGGGFLSLMGLKGEMPADLSRQVKGFVINGVVEKSQNIERVIDRLSTKTNWPCLGCLPWLNFKDENSYSEWQAILCRTLQEHAQPLVEMIL